MSRRIVLSTITLLAFSATADRLSADQAFVPGSGVRVTQVGDDFEDTSWGYIMNGPKASYEQDKQQRPPGGKSRNGRWHESAMRGHPDVIRRVPTPPGGIKGSQGALLMRTRLSGIPGQIANEQMQDDLIMGVANRIGQPVPVSWYPSCTVRVYLPEFHHWEQRSGASFGIRADVKGKNRKGEVEDYWPGFFILFRSKTSKQYDEDFAQIIFRAQPTGRDRSGPIIYEPGWWTFGMSFTPDGQVHYYARPGVDDLTEDDHLYSSFPYGWQCLFFDNLFFNVANWEDGKTWSTPWVIDDPQFFVIPPKGQTVAHLMRGGRPSVATRSNTRSSQSGFQQFGSALKRR